MPLIDNVRINAAYIGHPDECSSCYEINEWWECGLMRKSYVADFETTTDLNDCRVWGVGICKIGDDFTFEFGDSMDWFMGWCERNAQCNVYFHHLEFDGAFIMDWLLRNGWEWVERRDDAKERCFTTIISDANQVYCIELFFTHMFRVKIFNSLKIIPMSVERMGASYGLEARKGKIDYEAARPKGHVLTDDEIEYIRADVEIVAHAMSKFLDEGLNKMTMGSNALSYYQAMEGGLRGFRRAFPVLDQDVDEFVRKAYRGGYTFVNPQHARKRVEAGSVYDVNSLYPHVMRNMPMPYGYPVRFEGNPPEARGYPLWVAQITCSFRIRPGFFPCIQLKGNFRFGQTEYLERSDGEVTFTITNVDWELILRHYHIYDLKWHGGYAFHASTFRFKEYVDHWIEVKNGASIEGNKGLRQIAKLMLNSLYGKFATRTVVYSRKPVIVDDVLRYVDISPTERKPVYLPVGVFTTSYARYITVTAAQENHDRFLYADTDSLHLLGVDPPDGIEVDDVDLGKWKHECDFWQAKFIRAKCYIEYEDGSDEPTVHVAGMPASCHKHVTMDNFDVGAVYEGKLYTRRVAGGIVLVEDTMQIRL